MIRGAELDICFVEVILHAEGLISAGTFEEKMEESYAWDAVPKICVPPDTAVKN